MWNSNDNNLIFIFFFYVSRTFSIACPIKYIIILFQVSAFLREPHYPSLDVSNDYYLQFFTRIKFIGIFVSNRLCNR